MPAPNVRLVKVATIPGVKSHRDGVCGKARIYSEDHDTTFLVKLTADQLNRMLAIALESMAQAG